jgi:hypothetical protein
VERNVYAFGVEDVEITKVAKKAGVTKVAEKARVTKVAEKAGVTKVAEKAGVTKVAEKARVTEVAEMAEMTEGVRGIRTTTRHVVQPVAEMAKASIKTTRHVM